MFRCFLGLIVDEAKLQLLILVVCFFGAFLVKGRIDLVVRERNATSILIFTLAFIIGFATVMMSITGIVRYSDQDWCLEGLQPVCAS